MLSTGYPQAPFCPIKPYGIFFSWGVSGPDLYDMQRTGLPLFLSRFRRQNSFGGERGGGSEITDITLKIQNAEWVLIPLVVGHGSTD